MPFWFFSLLPSFCAFSDYWPYIWGNVHWWAVDDHTSLNLLIMRSMIFGTYFCYLKHAMNHLSPFWHVQCHDWWSFAKENPQPVKYELNSVTWWIYLSLFSNIKKSVDNFKSKKHHFEVERSFIGTILSILETTVTGIYGRVPTYIWVLLLLWIQT